MKKIEFLVLKIGQFERTSKNAHIFKAHLLPYV